jgi:hypothetical protein
MGAKRNAYSILVGKPEKEDHLEDIGGWIILSHVRVTLDGVLDWISHLLFTYTNNS